MIKFHTPAGETPQPRKNGKQAEQPKQPIIEQPVSKPVQQIAQPKKPVEPIKPVEIKHKLACLYPDDPNYHMHCPTCNKVTCIARYHDNDGPCPAYGCLVCDTLFKAARLVIPSR